MKLKKKTAMLISLAVGVFLFGSTALAEIASKGGYEQMKDALKITADNMATKMKSYTTDMSFVMKDNGNVIYSDNIVTKIDVSKKVEEITETRVDGNKKFESFRYRDRERYINYNSDQDVYYVHELSGSGKEDVFLPNQNPFKQKEAADIERIVDAFVGNLKDYVVVSQNSDGSKELSGTLSESQIPALVNAIVSFQFKNEFGYRASLGNGIPRMTKDIYVKEIKGKMVVDKNGIVQSVLGTGILYGKDDNDKEHNITFEVLGKLTNVNSTTVKKPDLTGKKVEKIVSPSENGVGNPESYIGTYKNNIVIQKDGKFIKIGERIVEITSFDGKNISGKYREEYLKGYENYASSGIKEYTFSGPLEKGGFGGRVNIQDSTGSSGMCFVSIHPSIPKINLNPETIKTNMNDYDGEFNRVFE
ncbi:hypothetical protein [Fonticella tunisiensis]|uniref:Uncharacterized protein n=1 Tax=Fonticella tunisiensis TaxID=1096341 RepID=A0A4R7KSR5_9CLOT|nr:hypothetical protein [Fonticella tunisiensis]TDT58469.1 hypothetical protein EDD71_111121 [Fonticella tunisiensis]